MQWISLIVAYHNIESRSGNLYSVGIAHGAFKPRRLDNSRTLIGELYITQVIHKTKKILL